MPVSFERWVEEADLLLERALAIFECVVGPQHPGTARSLVNLAAIYAIQGKYRKMESLYECAPSIYTRTLGLEHPTTQSVQRHYTALLEKMKQAESPE